MANTSQAGGEIYPVNHEERRCSGVSTREIAMTRITATPASAASQFDTIFSTVVTTCAEFCAGARQGRDIEQRYHDLECRSAPDLAKLGLTRTDIARAALTGTRH
jgi:hypothetical protein